MTFRMAIQGVGILAGFGNTIESAKSAMAQPPSPNSTIEVTLSRGVFQMPVYTADTRPLRDHINPKKLRRINKYSKMALLAAINALDDAGIDTDKAGEDIGIVLASGHGSSSTTFSFLDDIIRMGDNLASPTKFSTSLHSAATSNVTIFLNIRGPSLTVTNFDSSGIGALIDAQMLLATGQADTILLGAVEEVNSILAYSYANICDGISQEIEPMDFEKQTAVPGEGAVFMVLTADTAAAKYGYIETPGYFADWGSVIPEQHILSSEIILGANGCKKYAPMYSRVVNDLQSRRFRSLAKTYGSVPVNQIFDTALLAVDTALDSGSIINFHRSSPAIINYST